MEDRRGCEKLGGELFSNTLVCGNCQAELVPDGFISYKITASAVGSLGALIDVTLAAESDSVQIWEPLMGSIEAFDPFITTLTVTPQLTQGFAASMTIETENNIFADPQTSELRSASGTFTNGLGGTGMCGFDGEILDCGNNICFNPVTFVFGCV